MVVSFSEKFGKLNMAMLVLPLIAWKRGNDESGLFYIEINKSMMVKFKYNGNHSLLSIQFFFQIIPSKTEFIIGKDLGPRWK